MASDAPLSDVQRDALIRTLSRQCAERDITIRELRDALVEAHEELAALKAGIYPEAPFRA